MRVCNLKMKTYKIAVIPGDGIGPEVVEIGLSVLKKVANAYEFEIITKEFPFGAKHFLSTGEVLTDESLARFASL